MKLCGVLLLFFISSCYGKIFCPERAIAVDTPEGPMCVCTKGYSGADCLFKALPLSKNQNSSSNQTGKDECGSWHECFQELASSLVTRPAFQYGILAGLFIDVAALFTFYIVVKCSHRQARQQNARESGNETTSVSDDVVLDIHPEEITRSQTWPDFQTQIVKGISASRSLPCIVDIY